MMMLNYPDTRRDETTVDNYHGTVVADPYRWLENPYSEETKDFIDQQNSITNPYINSCLYKENISRQLESLWNYPKVSTPYFHKRYYQFHNSGLQNHSILYVQNDLNSEPEIFLDPNTFSENGTVALVNTSFTEDGNVLGYAVSTSGSDWVEIKFCYCERIDEPFKEVLQKVKYSFLTWSHDNKGCFYAGYLNQQSKSDGSETEASLNQKLYYHYLGTPQSSDVLVASFDDPQIRTHSGQVSHCGNYLVLTPTKGCKHNLLYYCHLKNVESIVNALPITPVITEFTADYEYITNNESKFIFRTNQDAPNYHLIVIDFENLAQSNWTVLVPEHSRGVLNWAKPINNHNLVLCYMFDAKHTLSLHELETGDKIMNFPLELGTINEFSGKREHTEMFFGFTSFLTPNTIYRVDFKQPEIKATVFHETKVGHFDPANYESNQIFYNSKDGISIPMFVVHKKGLTLDGSKPCLLYGYGGFNISVTPMFGVARLMFMENFDGIFVVANIRGGGEYGDNWHNAGRLENKQNAFDDFQYGARYLIENKYTTPDKLTIQGGSNGGLLVAACVNQAPELFGCAICMVGVLDLLRYHKFTIGYAWKSDYGSSENPEQFKYLYKYSPLHNIRARGSPYPAILLLTADHDDRVVPLHSLKFIAELQYSIGQLCLQTQPLLIRVDTKAGHGAGKPTAKLIEEQTDILCFMQTSLNLSYHD